MYVLWTKNRPPDFTKEAIYGLPAKMLMARPAKLRKLLYLEAYKETFEELYMICFYACWPISFFFCCPSLFLQSKRYAAVNVYLKLLQFVMSIYYEEFDLFVNMQ